MTSHLPGNLRPEDQGDAKIVMHAGGYATAKSIAALLFPVADPYADSTRLKYAREFLNGKKNERRAMPRQRLADMADALPPSQAEIARGLHEIAARDDERAPNRAAADEILAKIKPGAIAAIRRQFRAPLARHRGVEVPLAALRTMHERIVEAIRLANLGRTEPEIPSWMLLGGTWYGVGAVCAAIALLAWCGVVRPAADLAAWITAPLLHLSAITALSIH
ncbi:MAG: hypothetical protein ACYDDA_08085 [Acidiferrobacteraceae bacterium]